MKRPLKEIIESLENLPRTAEYFIDFPKALKNAEVNFESIELLEPLLKSINLEEDFLELLKKEPKLIKIIPALIGIRESEVKLKSGKIAFRINTNDLEDYLKFLKETGFFKVIEAKNIDSMKSYLIGVEVGINTNARKNRGGKLMETLVSEYMNDYGIHFIEQANDKKIMSEFGINVMNSNKKSKVFDFAFKKGSKLYLVEANAFSSGGSKINSEIGRFIKENDYINELKNDNIEFIWITDGLGIKTALNDFEVAYSKIKNIWTIKDLKDGILDII